MLNTMMFLHTYTHTYTQTLTPILPIDSVNEPIQTRALRLLFTLARHTKYTYIWIAYICLNIGTLLLVRDAILHLLLLCIQN